MNNIVTLPPELQEATENLIENLRASEAFLTYQKALTSMNSDQEVLALLERLSTKQAELRRMQSIDSVTQPDVEELRAVQMQVQSYPAIMDYALSQQDAVSLLREINQEISELLGVDFASLAKQSTCC